MTVMSNGRALGIAVGNTMILPNGRAVPCADVSGWDESDADVEDCTEDCRRVAEKLNEEEIRYQASTSRKPPARRDLPDLPPPAPYRPSGDLADFEVLCEDVLVALRLGPTTTWSSATVARVENMLDFSRVRGGPTPNILCLVLDIEEAFASWPERTATFLGLCAEACALTAAEAQGLLPAADLDRACGIIQKLRETTERLGTVTPGMFNVVWKIRVRAQGRLSKPAAANG